MKGIITSVFVASLLLITACSDKKEGEVESTTPKIETKNVGDLKIAFYDQDSLKVYFDYYREQDSIVTKKQLGFQNEVQRRTMELQNYLVKNDERARSGLLSQNEILQIQQVAQQKEASLMQYQQTEGAKLEEETYNKLEAIGNKIELFAKKYCEENGIDILMIYAKGGQFNYINSSMDVTKEFTTYLNDQQKSLAEDIKK
ncbi:MAG: OmpH family outer membrane protein [Crocinitomicaceae bacterium]|nr:OmpH family outer membrane protein [Crocinitomicaceae bacterium]